MCDAEYLIPGVTRRTRRTRRRRTRRRRTRRRRKTDEGAEADKT